MAVLIDINRRHHDWFPELYELPPLPPEWEAALDRVYGCETSNAQNPANLVGPEKVAGGDNESSVVPMHGP